LYDLHIWALNVKEKQLLNLHPMTWHSYATAGGGAMRLSWHETNRSIHISNNFRAVLWLLASSRFVCEFTPSWVITKRCQSSVTRIKFHLNAAALALSKNRLTELADIISRCAAVVDVPTTRRVCDNHALLISMSGGCINPVRVFAFTVRRAASYTRRVVRQSNKCKIINNTHEIACERDHISQSYLHLALNILPLT